MGDWPKLKPRKKKNRELQLFFASVVYIAVALIGAFVALYLCLYGGIVAVTIATTSGPVIPEMLAWGIIRILFTFVVLKYTRPIAKCISTPIID